MAYVVSRPAGAWELRESRATSRGPRSRTLASFRTLTAEVVEHARERSEGGLTRSEARAAAHRAGAPVALDAPDAAAATLIRELDRGRAPRPALLRALAAVLSDEGRPGLRTSSVGPTEPGEAISANARAAASWASAAPVEHGAALRDLLLLADRLPHPARTGAIGFPRLPAASA